MWCPNSNFQSYFLWTIFILLLLLHICGTYLRMLMRGKLFSRWKDGRLCSHFLETIQWTEWRKVRLCSHLPAHQWWPPLSFLEHIALMWIHFTNENAQWRKVRLSALTLGHTVEKRWQTVWPRLSFLFRLSALTLGHIWNHTVGKRWQTAWTYCSQQVFLLNSLLNDQVMMLHKIHCDALYFSDGSLHICCFMP